MIVFISPAKGFNEVKKSFVDEPMFIDSTKKIVEVLKTYDANALGKLFKVNETLASLNVQRYQAFESLEKMPALFAYSGMQYKAIDAISLDYDSISFLQEHLRILSGLYGVVRPLDGIRPYRLEMLTKVSIAGKKDLYAYYGDSIYRALKDDVIVNLASNEYAKCVEPYLEDETYVSIVFQVKTDKGLKVMSTASKKARGMMVRYIAKKKIQDYKELMAFCEDGYAFDETQSVLSGKRIVYTFVK